MLLLAGLLTGCDDKPSEHMRIVSLSPTATEILYAVGADDDVVAVDGLSDYPPQARQKSVDKIHAINPDIGEIMRYKPSLVILADYTGSDGGKGIISELRDRKVKVYLERTPSDLTGAYTSIEKIGELTHHTTQANDIADHMRKKIGNLVRSTPSPPRDTRYYHEIDNSYYSATSHTFIGSVYAEFGIQDIADPYDVEGSGYPKLTPRQIISADPDLIFLADTRCCGQNLKTVRERSGWKAIKAVRSGKVIEIDDDVSSRWGPRLVDFVEAISKTLKKGQRTR
ncbi:ABC transporter substrate-binding protein [Streptomyces sp. MBT53]|uniref:ABC transporter substrate-binding protein n=1 Tax=Streptomyces sp. MBT53 TaxID=1488384 RepID=UPI0019142B63|nr:helical backbone metal receptor [Streptomyces sp. MBT53]MBK6014993.1 ABC transporter substrate-binding protein [Streptomyces sp. MBT53]